VAKKEMIGNKFGFWKMGLATMALSFVLWPFWPLNSVFLRAETKSSLSPVGFEERLLTTASGDKLHLFARRFQPGELILARLEPGNKIIGAWIGLNQHRYQFLKILAENPEYIAFISLDATAEPGDVLFRLTIVRPDKTWEASELMVKMEAKEYRKRKIQVAPEYVQPPTEVQERIEREAELLRAIFSVVSPSWLGDGPFLLPHHGKLSAYFGDQRVYNERVSSFHNGVDIIASWGEPVRAANSGRVVAASSFYFSGKMVVIDHGLGLFTSYNHLSRLLVRRGQEVKRGEIIGLVGSSGLSTGAHLHWSARIATARVDPLSLLALPFPVRTASNSQRK